MDRKERAFIALGVLLLLIVLAGICASVSRANPWCGPANGPAGMLWPNVQSCMVPIPGLGGMARVPGLQAPQNVPYRSHPAAPFWPVPLP